MIHSSNQEDYSQNKKSVWAKIGLKMDKFIRIDHSPNRCI
jgi:hypothetical protein